MSFCVTAGVSRDTGFSGRRPCWVDRRSWSACGAGRSGGEATPHVQSDHRARVVAEYTVAPRREKVGALQRDDLYQSQTRERIVAQDNPARGVVPRRNLYHRPGESSGQEVDRLVVEEYPADPGVGDVVGGAEGW